MLRACCPTAGCCFVKEMRQAATGSAKDVAQAVYWTGMQPDLVFSARRREQNQKIQLILWSSGMGDLETYFLHEAESFVDYYIPQGLFLP